MRQAIAKRLARQASLVHPAHMGRAFPIIALLALAACESTNSNDWTGGATTPNWKAYADTLAAYYDLPEDERPPLDTIPEPQPRRYTYVKWGKVRKATLEREAREGKRQAKRSEDS